MALTKRQQLFTQMRERIDNGVRWLETRPTGYWDAYASRYHYDREQILNGNWLQLDLAQLNLIEGEYCVLGQVGRSYVRVKGFAGLDDEGASRLGFSLDRWEYGREEIFTIQDWDVLTTLWCEKIRAMRRTQQTVKTLLHT